MNELQWWVEDDVIKKGLRKKKKALRKMKLATLKRRKKFLSPEKMQTEILKRPSVKRGVVSCATANTGEGRGRRKKRQQYKRGSPQSQSGAWTCLLYTSPSPRDLSTSRMPSSA